MADVTISGLTQAPSVVGTDVVPISNGSTTYKATVQQLLSISSNAYMIDFLIVAGGGGGGAGAYAGGGGAGGFVTGSSYVDPGTRYGLIVGGGGPGGNRGSAGYQQGKNGENSSFLGMNAIGGGGGGSYNVDRFQFGRPGGSSGGHSGYSTSWQYTVLNVCVLGQGNIGALGATYGGGGGGGAGSPGEASPDGNSMGVGGKGLPWLDGVYYAGGGGGGSYNTAVVAPGGQGGGGTGGSSSNASGAVATSGTNGLGGGGGGAGWLAGSATHNIGGNGGSGIVKLRYFGAQRGTGGTVTSSGGYTYHTFITVGGNEYLA